MVKIEKLDNGELKKEEIIKKLKDSDFEKTKKQTSTELKLGTLIDEIRILNRNISKEMNELNATVHSIKGYLLFFVVLIILGMLVVFLPYM